MNVAYWLFTLLGMWFFALLFTRVFSKKENRQLRDYVVVSVITFFVGNIFLVIQYLGIFTFSL